MMWCGWCGADLAGGTYCNRECARNGNGAAWNAARCKRPPRDVMVRKYVTERKNTIIAGRELGMSHTTFRKWLEWYAIARREPGRARITKAVRRSNGAR